MITVKCAKCKTKIFKYRKFGKGKLWHCWKDRIVADYSVRDGELVRCPVCGNVIGVDQKKWIKLKPGRYIYSGTYEH